MNEYGSTINNNNEYYIHHGHSLKSIKHFNPIQFFQGIIIVMALNKLYSINNTLYDKKIEITANSRYWSVVTNFRTIPNKRQNRTIDKKLTIHRILLQHQIQPKWHNKYYVKLSKRKTKTFYNTIEDKKGTSVEIGLQEPPYLLCFSLHRSPIIPPITPVRYKNLDYFWK